MNKSEFLIEITAQIINASIYLYICSVLISLYCIGQMKMINILHSDLISIQTYCKSDFCHFQSVNFRSKKNKDDVITFFIACKLYYCYGKYSLILYFLVKGSVRFFYARVRNTAHRCSREQSCLIRANTSTTFPEWAASETTTKPNATIIHSVSLCAKVASVHTFFFN